MQTKNTTTSNSYTVPTPVPTPSPVPTPLGHSSGAVSICYAIGEDKGCCTPVKGSLADVTLGIWAGLKDPLQFPAVGASDIVAPVSLTSNQQPGWASYFSSFFWENSDQSVVFDIRNQLTDEIAFNEKQRIRYELQRAMNKLIPRIIKGHYTPNRSQYHYYRSEFRNYQKQLNDATELKDLTDLQDKVKKLDVKIRHLEKLTGPQKPTADRSSVEFFATATSAPALPALTAPANLTLSKVE